MERARDGKRPVLARGGPDDSPAIAAAAAAPVREVARLMLDQGVGAVPVLDALGAAIGMASDDNVLRGRGVDDRRDWCLKMLADAFRTGDLSGLGCDWTCGK